MSQLVVDVCEAEESAAPPSVESENPEERIAARRLRIAARNDAKKRQELGEEDRSEKEEEVKEETKRRSHQQVEQSEMRMTELQRDGSQLVTDVQIAADFRLSERRAQTEEARRLRVEKLENDARSGLALFEEVTGKWTVAKTKQIPQDLRDALNSQQQLCAQIIQDKNRLINELQRELKANDDRYVKDLKKQAQDIDLMLERMESQVQSLLKTYREQLDQTEKAYDDERQVLLTGNNKKWEQLMRERCDKELESLTEMVRKVEENEESLQQIRQDDAEHYNTVKITLEQDIEGKQLELQQQRAIYQLNQEKLEYNYHVLKKRDEENAIAKSQQKRKINRLHDVLNQMKSRCSQQERQARQENLSHAEDYKRITQHYKDAQNKTRHFAAVDAKRFEDVWLMNEAEVKALAEKALDVDRIIHQQQLGLAWERPLLAFMERCGPVGPQRQAQRTARQTASALLHGGQTGQSSSPGLWAEASVEPGVLGDAGAEPGGGGPGLAVEVYGGGAEGQSSGEAEREARGGEQQGEAEREARGEEQQGEVTTETVQKLLELLCDEGAFLVQSEFLEEDVRSLKLESIFSAVGIESQEDVHKMADFFTKYKREQAKDDVSAGSDDDLIDPNDLLAALRAFTAQQQLHREALRSQRSGVPGVRDDSEDAAYWESMANVIPDDKIKIWDALQTHLEKYHRVLTERAQFITDTQCLKQQNTELRMLLHQYVNSSINDEFEIPPTQAMKLAPE